MVKYQEIGYINRDVFDAWVENIFISSVRERRLKYNYTEPVVLILDGGSSHYTTEFFDLCNQNNVKIFFIPPHSHKTNVRKARLFEVDNDNLLIDKIQMLLNSFFICCLTY